MTQRGVAAVAGASATLTNAQVAVEGGSADQAVNSAWGTHSGVVVSAGSTVTLVGGRVRTAGLGAGAGFSTGTGSKLIVLGTRLATTQESSRGLTASFGGSVQASELLITTKGAGSPALATDRGGGTLTITRGTLKTSGESSPALYCTGELTVSESVAAAEASEGAVIEGKNTITPDRHRSDRLAEFRGADFPRFLPATSPGRPVFSASGGSLTALDGPLFSIVNTQAVVNLKHVILVAASGDALLRRRRGCRQRRQPDPDGDLEAAGGSLTLVLKNTSSWRGACNPASTATVNLTLDPTSTWTVTADSRVNALNLAGLNVTTLTRYLITGGHTVAYQASANSWLGDELGRLTMAER